MSELDRQLASTRAPFAWTGLSILRTLYASINWRNRRFHGTHRTIAIAAGVSFVGAKFPPRAYFKELRALVDAGLVRLHKIPPRGGKGGALASELTPCSCGARKRGCRHPWNHGKTIVELLCATFAELMEALWKRVRTAGLVLVRAPSEGLQRGRRRPAPKCIETPECIEPGCTCSAAAPGAEPGSRCISLSVSTTLARTEPEPPPPLRPRGAPASQDDVPAGPSVDAPSAPVVCVASDGKRREPDAEPPRAPSAPRDGVSDVPPTLRDPGFPAGKRPRSESESNERRGATVVPLARLAEAADVVHAHRKARGHTAAPTRRELALIATLLALGWAAADLALAGEGQRASAWNRPGSGRDGAAWLYASEDRVQACLDVGRRLEARRTAKAAHEAARAAREAAEPAPAEVVSGGRQLDVRFYDGGELGRRIAAAEARVRETGEAMRAAFGADAARSSELARVHAEALAAVAELRGGAS